MVDKGLLFKNVEPKDLLLFCIQNNARQHMVNYICDVYLRNKDRFDTHAFNMLEWTVKNNCSCKTKTDIRK